MTVYNKTKIKHKRKLTEEILTEDLQRKGKQKKKNGEKKVINTLCF